VHNFPLNFTISFEKNRMKKFLASLCLPLQLIATDLIPRDQLFRKPPCMAIKLCPDGQKLGFVGSDKEGTMNVFVSSDLTLENATQLTYFTEPTIRAFHWSPDGKKIYLLKDKNGTRLFHLYSLNPVTSELKDLTASYGRFTAKFFEISAKENKAIIGINNRNPKFHDLYLLDFTDDSLSLIYQNDQFANFLFDEHLNIVLKMRLNEDSTVSYLDKEDQIFMNLSAQDAFHTQMLACTNGSLYLLDTRDSDTTQLVKITGEKKEVIGHDKQSDIQDILFESNQPVAYASYYTLKEWHPLNGTIKCDLDFLIEKLGSNFSILDRSADYKTWVVKTSIPDKGIQFWLYQRSLQTVSLLFSCEQSYLQPMHPIVIPARDGLQLVSYLTLPTHNQDGRVPLVIIPHGGPFHGRDSYGFSPYHQWLANRGYAVLSVNFRLSSGFGKTHVTKGNGEWGGKAHEDILDAVQWCIDQDIVDKDKVAILGGSYGGYEALASLTFSPDVFACGIAICGPSSLKTVMDKVPFYWETPTAPLSDKSNFFTKNAFIISMGNSKSPLHFVDNIKKPLLLVHGENDPIVAASESDQIYEKLKEKNLPAIYLKYPDEGHGLAKYANDMCCLAYCEKLLADVLGGKYEPISEDLLKQTSCKFHFTVPFELPTIPTEESLNMADF
jgi:dipeptidyl aminopeptidase/acylaminoacyl peptidase